MKSIIIVSTTFEQKDDAERIADLLLERRLIACAQISSPIMSLYRWEGKTASSTEFTLSLKTTPLLVKRVKKLLVQEHPYDLPEIIGQEAHDSSKEYLEWVYGETQQ